MFTGDRSGDFLYRVLFDTGFASQPTSTNAADGLSLVDCYITASAHCAPPGNKPTNEELRTCRPYLERELELLLRVQVVVALGRIAFDTYLAAAAHTGPRPGFGHACEHSVPGRPILISSYHPSQQNTSTGRLTDSMLRSVFLRVRYHISNAGS